MYQLGKCAWRKERIRGVRQAQLVTCATTHQLARINYTGGTYTLCFTNSCTRATTHTLPSKVMHAPIELRGATRALELAYGETSHANSGNLPVVQTSEQHTCTKLDAGAAYATVQCQRVSRDTPGRQVPPCCSVRMLCLSYALNCTHSLARQKAPCGKPTRQRNAQSDAASNSQLRHKSTSLI